MAKTALDKLVDKLQDTYNNGVIMDFRRGGSIEDVERIPLESPKIESLFGIGGVPRGRIIEIYGTESGGKTSLCEYIAGQFQKHDFEYVDEKGEIQTRKGVVIYIDAEHSIAPDYALVHGFDMSKCILVQPDSGEQACDIALQMAESGQVDLIILDSIASMTPQAEIDGDMEQQSVGVQARMLSKFFRKAVAVFGKTKTTMLCINQIRMNIGTYGNPETTPGGKALKFYSSVRIEMRRREYITEKDDTKGIVITAKTVKNKTAPPMVKQQLEMYFDKSFDASMEWVDFAIEYQVIEQGGAGYFTLPDGNRIRGKSNLADFLSLPESSELYESIKKKTKERMYKKQTDKPIAPSVDSPEEEREALEEEGE